MKAVILAGGFGLRLRETVKNLPKAMAPITGRPFMEYLILQLKKWGVNEIILGVGYLKEKIKSYFGNGKQWDVHIVYSEENKPLGTGGALKKAVRLIDDEEFLVMNGDSFLDLNFNRIISLHRKRKAVATIGLTCVDDLSRYGKVEINSRNEVIKFAEKSSVIGRFINGGVYVFTRKIINCIPMGKVSLENDVFPALINQGLYGMTTKGFFVDIGVSQDFFDLCKNPEKLLNAV